ncbi:hypothetical protein PLICRDRAFT_115115 [Plicaturopsis crispa FD-325 SS-3]|nr:hypothetical protein PLICRDRAFT_115115 [Plicaturopsis crispa FD-325 SS-3]
MYVPHTGADRIRYVENTQLEPPIIFHVRNPDEWGIPLTDALRTIHRRLHDRDEQVFQHRGPSVSIRIEWPGYAPWSRQIPTKDFRNPPGPITRQKLAKNIAKNVQRFLDHAAKKAMDEEADGRWRIGPRGIKFEDLALVSLHHVSMGSWQPHLRLIS